jgi:hypothetical protein
VEVGNELMGNEDRSVGVIALMGVDGTTSCVSCIVDFNGRLCSLLDCKLLTLNDVIAGIV